jgi:hypothetical protein
VDAIPKDRVQNILLRFPLPVGLTPQGLIFIATGIDKLEIFAVGHFVLIDGKCGHGNGVRFVLVVPAKNVRVAP